jgi:hypothetical protein
VKPIFAAIRSTASENVVWSCFMMKLKTSPSSPQPKQW